MMHKTCRAGGKQMYPTRDDVKLGAKNKARKMLRVGRLVDSMYTYRCPHCRHWHITRNSKWDGEPLHLVFLAPPLDSQLWAMPAMSRTADVEAEVERRTAPQPVVPTQRYANRPKVLRRA